MLGMETAVRIVAAERVNEGVLIEFNNGQVALFPAHLLWALVPGFSVKSLVERAEDIAAGKAASLKDDKASG